MRILLAVDGSYHSDAALETVMNRPWPESTEVLVLTVIEPLSNKLGPFVPQKVIEAQQLLEEDLTEVCKQAGARLAEKFGAGKVKTEIVEGNPKDKILENARNWGSQLIVMGSHGGGGFSGLPLGSVSNAILSTAPCNVEVIKALDLEALARKADRHEPLIESKYLVAIDTSEEAPKIIDSILARPWPAGSKFQVMHVVEPLSHHQSGLIKKLQTKSAQKMEQLSELVCKEHIEKAETLTRECAKKLEEKLGKGRVTHHVLEGNVRSMILQIAQDWPADLIFVGSHGVARWNEFLLGSVTTAIVRNTDCSVEVVKI